MRSLFDINGPIITFLTKIFDFMMLSFLWIIFSLPVFTIGASTSAVFAVIQKHIKNGEGYFWKTFWTSYKSAIAQNWLVWLIMLFIGVILGVDAVILRSMKLAGYASGNLYWVLLFLIVLFVTWFIYVAVYVELIEGKTKDVIRYTLLMLALHPIKAIENVVLVGVGAALVLTVPVTMIIVPGLLGYLTSYVIVQVFSLHLSEEDAKKLLQNGKLEDENEEINHDK